MNPLVSVIVPVYNASPYLRETLDSIVASDYAPIEVIIQDDGSNDDSLAIAQAYGKEHNQCKVFTQVNQGVSAARNHAIAHAQGEYILPVDADDKISSDYIRLAVEAIDGHEQVRVVGCRARMFGMVDKPWNLPSFSHALLARKNMIPITSLFRKSDWERCGGFCEEDIYREDWDFWLSMFELGGEYVLLPIEGLYYRVLPQSRRRKAKQQKRVIVDAINRRHPTYLQKYLGGRLHYHRSWSRFLNTFSIDRQVGDFEDWEQGTTIYQKRNTLRVYQDYVIKQFAVPSIGRQIAYCFTSSKAKRSYSHALRLGPLTPAPVAYREIRFLGLFIHQSWYVSRLSECKHTFNELIGHPDFPHRVEILQAIGRFTAQMHQRGLWHKDYSGGNILFNEDGSKVEVIDLNRMCSVGCHRHHLLKQLERLNIDREALTIIATAYAEMMGLDVQASINYAITHRWKKHVKQSITNL